jgi:hypothetical protein
MSASSNLVAETYMAPPDAARWQSRALIVGVIALVISVAGGIANPTQFFRSYLIGFFFWLGIALGSLALLMLQYLTGGDWAMMIRRPLESATRTLPWMLLLFVPLAFGMRRVYVWAVPGTVLPPHKAIYLTVPFFLTRAAIYFAVWIVLQWLLNRWSHQQDETGDVKFKLKLTYLAGPGLLLYGLTVSFASVDWIMSLDFRDSDRRRAIGVRHGDDDCDSGHAGARGADGRRLPIAPLPRFGQAALRVRDALGLFFSVAVDHHLVRQPAGGNFLVHVAHRGGMALGGIVSGDCALRAALRPVALAGFETPASAPGLDRGTSSGGAPGGCLLADRS